MMAVLQEIAAFASIVTPPALAVGLYILKQMDKRMDRIEEAVKDVADRETDCQTRTIPKIKEDIGYLKGKTNGHDLGSRSGLESAR